MSTSPTLNRLPLPRRPLRPPPRRRSRPPQPQPPANASPVGESGPLSPYLKDAPMPEDIQMLRDELAALNRRLSSTEAGTPGTPVAGEEPKAEPGQKAEATTPAPAAAELPAPATITGTALSYPSAADVAKMVTDGI